MNIHEHQAKIILKNYGAKVPNGIFASNVKDLLEKAKTLDILYLRKVLKKSQIFSACFKSNSTWLAFKYLGPEQCNTFSANQLLYYFGCSIHVTHADFQYKSKEE